MMIESCSKECCTNNNKMMKSCSKECCTNKKDDDRELQ